MELMKNIGIYLIAVLLFAVLFVTGISNTYVDTNYYLNNLFNIITINATDYW